jgi:5-methylcytosine-specific restriction endonuclease McrA
MKKKLCNYPGCNNLIDMGERYCGEHIRERASGDARGAVLPFQNAVRTNAHLYNTARWRKLQKRIIRENPSCFKCGIGRHETALQVHHLVEPRGNEELFFDEANLVPVCNACHRILTAKEIWNRKDR